MAALTLTRTDLEPFAAIEEAKADAMIADALGIAQLIAPCMFEFEFAYPDAAKAVIRGAILRWNAADSGAITTRQAGSFQETIDSTTRRNGMFWPSEISQLQSMCSTGKSDAFGIDTVSSVSVQHADICSINLGGLYCSCGAILTGLSALWEN